jgi:hypothetical protein
VSASVYREFPASRVEEFFAGPVEIAKFYGLDRAGTSATVEAYEASVEYFGPFNTWLADSILRALRQEAEEKPGLQVGLLARDVLTVDAAMRNIDPVFYAERCRVVVISSRIVAAAMLDYEKRTGRVISVAPADGYDDWRRARVANTPYVDNALRYLTEYLHGIGIPVGQEGTAVSWVDNGIRGTAQQIFSALWPETDMRGHYCFLAQPPGDPTATRKQGHLFHLPETYYPGGAGVVGFMPDDEDMTFLCEPAAALWERLTPGPMPSAEVITRKGPDRSLPDPLSLDGMPRPSDIRYLSPAVREAVLLVIQLAAAHHAAAAPKDAPPHRSDLLPFTRHVRSWLTGNGEVDRRLVNLFEGFSVKPDDVAIRAVQPISREVYDNAKNSLTVIESAKFMPDHPPVSSLDEYAFEYHRGRRLLPYFRSAVEMALHGAPHGARVLNPGARTGLTAAQLLAFRPDLNIVCAEPSRPLRDLLERELGSRVEVAEVQPDEIDVAYGSGRFDLVVFDGDSYTWMDANRVHLATDRVVKENARVVVLFNIPDFVPVMSGIERVRNVLHPVVAFGNGGHRRGTWDGPGFDAFTAREFRWEADYTHAEIKTVYSSFVEYLSLPPVRRDRFLHDIDKVLERVAVPNRRVQTLFFRTLVWQMDRGLYVQKPR